MNSQSQVSGHAAPKGRGHTDKRSKRNLLFMGSAAVVAVYSAGFFHTAAAAAKLNADEESRAGASGRGGNRDFVRPETASSPAPAVTSATAVAKLPVAAPSTPPPVAATSPLQTPAPAPSPAPDAAPRARAVVVTLTAAPVGAASVQAPASAPNPVPTAPVQVAALPVAPAPASPGSVTTTVVPAAVTTEVKKKYNDGAYFGWGRCRHGELKVIIELKDDKIISANIAECYTQYSKNVISRLPGQMVARQNVNALDRISGASDSSDAYYYAVVEALKAAKL